MPRLSLLFAGMARSYTLLLTLTIAHVLRHLGECG
jgi:hypothetical protein